jgi:predicted ABC-type ATPase
MAEIIIVAGPNGAGKTTFANEFLAVDEMAYVNADEIARGLEDVPASELHIRAGRLMLQQINALIEARTDFMFETTLASLIYARRIPEWRQLGWHVGLAYLRLPTVEASIARVRRRVQAGGHDIPEGTIRRRFSRSLEYLETRYKLLVNEWRVYDSLEGDFQLVSAWDDQ